MLIIQKLTVRARCITMQQQKENRSWSLKPPNELCRREAGTVSGSGGPTKYYTVSVWRVMCMQQTVGEEKKRKGNCAPSPVTGLEQTAMAGSVASQPASDAAECPPAVTQQTPSHVNGCTALLSSSHSYALSLLCSFLFHLLHSLPPQFLSTTVPLILLLRLIIPFYIS